VRDGRDGKLRAEVVPGAYYKRLCVCPNCGSAKTKCEGMPRGERRMACQRCDFKFVAREASRGA